MQHSRKTVVILGISSIGVVLVVTAWFAWPSSSEDDIKENLDITGDNNKVKTIQTKYFSLVHIEGLRAETGAHITNVKETANKNNWITWGMIGVICFVLMAWSGFLRRWNKGMRPRERKKKMKIWRRFWWNMAT